MSDLRSILAYTESHFPKSVSALQERIRVVLTRISRMPQSARPVVERPGVRVVPLGRYPFKIFYRVSEGTVQILHIHHMARQDPWTGDR